MFRKKSLILLAVSCLVFTLAVVAPVFADGMQHVLIPSTVFFGGQFPNSCYNGGEGENLVDLMGDTHLSMKEINGGYVFHINGIKGSATGETSGDTYQFNGGLQEVLVNGGNTWNLVHNVRIVSNDQNNSYQLKWRSHFTVTPDGQVVVDSELEETICS